VQVSWRGRISCWSEIIYKDVCRLLPGLCGVAIPAAMIWGGIEGMEADMAVSVEALQISVDR
jgi:hypothetical protein